MAYDPFDDVPAANAAPTTASTQTQKTVTVPEKPDYILGIEARTFYGIFIGILLTIIFISLMEAE